MSTTIYFVQGSIPRLNFAIQDFKANSRSIEDTHFILSGSSLMNPNPKETEAKKLEQELMRNKHVNAIHNLGQVHLNEMGIERLGCFYEGIQTINEIAKEREISEIIMPIEYTFHRSYWNCFWSMLDPKLVNLFQTRNISHNPTMFQSLSESIVRNSIALDTINFKTPKDWNNYILNLKHYNGTNKHKTYGAYPLVWAVFEKFFQEK